MRDLESLAGCGGGRTRTMVSVPAEPRVTLILISLAESTILVDFGWLTFVICCVKASQELSWRSALRSVEAPEP